MSEREQFEAAFLANPSGGGLSEFCWRIWQAARAQPAQAGQVLTDESTILRLARESHQSLLLEGRGMELLSPQARIADWQEFCVRLTRAIEQAVLAKRVPMTEAQAKDIADSETWGPEAIAMEAALIRVVRATERHHGIGGEKGGA